MEKENKRQNSRKYFLIISSITIPFLIAISISAVFLVLYSISKYGSAITHDSVAYIYASGSLLSGKGMLYFGYDSPFVQWGPLFPLVLAGLESLGANLIIATAYFNGIVYALIILISGLWVLKATKKGILALMTSLAILVSIPLYYVSTFIWSETLFIFFTILFLILIEKYVEMTLEEQGQKIVSLKYLIFASIVAALACLTRYIGITVIIAGVIILLLQKKKFINKLLEIVLFGTIAATPTIIWVVRNYILTETLTGGRFPSTTSINENTGLFFKTIALWITSADSQTMAYFILGIFIFISLIIIFTKKNHLTSKIIALLIFLIIYSAYLLFSASSVSFDGINNRLISPIYPVLVLLIIFNLASIASKENARMFSKVFYNIVMVILFLSWIIYPSTEIFDAANYSYENGAGILASKWWENSPLIQYVREIPSDSIICSNCPDAVYIHSGKKSIYLPKKEGLDLYGLDQFRKIVNENENVYIIWFEASVAGNMYDVEQLKEFFTIEDIDTLYDGIIYRILSK